MTHAHAVIWLDHHEAKIIQFNPDISETRHLKHPGDDRLKDFYHAIAKGVDGVNEVLVTGPGAAKDEFMKHIKQHDPDVARRVLGVETADHPSEGQILAHARQYFKGKDRMVAH